jgi:phosphoglycolate phosphatase
MRLSNSPFTGNSRSLEDMTTPHLVIFDCDGTLVDSQNAIVASMEFAFRAHGVEPPPRAEILSIVGLSLPRAVEVLMPNHPVKLAHQISESYKTGFGATIIDESKRDPLFPGADLIVEKLAATSDITLGIATGKSMRGVHRLLDREDWRAHFATIQTADNAPSKPDPGMILQAMAETGAEPETTIMIGDTTYDIDMARAAGVHAIGVTWGYHPVASLEKSGAHVIVEDFIDLLRAIRAHTGVGGAHG